MQNADKWIQDLNLMPLPEEGGMYREIYRSQELITQAALPKRFTGDRCYATSIYYLLKYPEFSAFHRLKQEEIWHFYDGQALTLHIIDLQGNYAQKMMGRNIDNGEVLQHVVYAGQLFAAMPTYKDSYSLVGCTVAPGFEFTDLEIPSRKVLLNTYPQHKDTIMQFTHP
ncbi:hypothetical protein TI03_05000 [Achromatium sp. WMS1]|nr:hypothetical protein TI03_05000 [Achromatium sp. WMS1]